MADLVLAKKLYRILTWASVVGLVVTIMLVLRKSPAPDVPYDAAAAARVEQKFAAADQAKASGQQGKVEVQLDRTELNSYLAQNLDLGNHAVGNAPSGGAASGNASPGAPGTSGSSGTDPLAGIAGPDTPTLDQVQSAVKDVKVDMDGDLVKAYVIFDFHGKELSLELDGHLKSDGGYIKFEPVAGKLGSLPLPKSTLDAAVEKLMNSPENREKMRLPADISDIQIQDGQAMVTYK
jgi:hypothetical protein